MLHELDTRAAHRELLLDPRVAPQEVLGWLAGFVGLALDRRWPEHARRTLIARAYPLMRRRGTVDALTEMLEIYLGRRPAVVERWRIRGGPGAVLGRRDGNARAVLGDGLRISGNAGATAADGFAVAAHRFCVLVPQLLTTEQRDVVRSVVERHKPAHSTFEISEVGAGMRVGRRLHLGLTAVVGPPGGPEFAVTGSTALGAATVGRAAVGSRLGRDSLASGVRVG
jgi:phage tail-like protein